jgi:hypothetical protein
MACIIEFVGGPHDGKRVSSDSENANEATQADSYYRVFTREGTVGKRFSVGSEAAIDFINAQQSEETELPNFRLHMYEVIERIEQDGDTIVRCKFVGVEP